MFQFLFLEAVGRRTGCSRDSVLNLYNSSCGRPTAGMRAALKSEVGRILEVLVLVITTTIIYCTVVFLCAYCGIGVPHHVNVLHQLQCNGHTVLLTLCTVLAR
jgi:uncharacterized Fe-S radical SAM superfamily protein PflX